jgi:Aminotransferase class I and II/Thiamine pyrophosphate enzyme, N-terminal TPP binding domain
VHALPIWEGLRASSLRSLWMGTELCAGFAADGYARVSGRAAPLILSTGPGALNPRRDGARGSAGGRTPRVGLRSQQPDRVVGRGRRVGALLDALPTGCVAVVDEAYIDFVAPERRLERARDVDTGRPVVLVRTFSKVFGLPGLRLGYAVAHPALAPFFDVVQEPFNVNRAALVAGRASLARADAVEGRRRETAAARELLARRLAATGIAAAPSEANFLLAHVGTDGEALARRLAARGVLVRPGADFGMEPVVRITVAPEEAMERAAAAIAHARDELAA